MDDVDEGPELVPALSILRAQLTHFWVRIWHSRTKAVGSSSVRTAMRSCGSAAQGPASSKLATSWNETQRNKRGLANVVDPIGLGT